jgi:superfamily II DNA or RNA helicase
VIEKVAAVFESYWHSSDFIDLDETQFEDHARAAKQAGPRIYLSPVELRPEPFQERMLEQLEVARSQGQHRNLLVSATGTGKTVMAAVDYTRLRQQLPRDRLLFVAHRKEILEQSLATSMESAPNSSSMSLPRFRACTHEVTQACLRTTSTSSSSMNSTTRPRAAIKDCWNTSNRVSCSG